MDPISFSEHKGYFTAFLDTKRGDGYDQKLRFLAKAADGRKSQRLLVSVNDLRQFDTNLTNRLLRRPLHFLAPWTEAITERVQQYRTEIAGINDNVMRVARTHLGFIGAFGSCHVSPRELRACQLGALVCVEGVVTRCSLSQPKVVRSVHWCSATQQHTTREYRDSTALDLNVIVTTPEAKSGGDRNVQIPTDVLAYPTCDADGNILETEFGMSVYKDHQSVTIQESPERAPLGQLPRSVQICVV